VANESTRQIAEYSRILSQLLSEVSEQNFLTDHTKGLLSKTQFTILKILSVSGPYTVSSIANILLISRAAASKNIDKLVRQKLVNRKITLEDRRVMEVTLTDKGLAIIKKYEKVRFEKQNAALAQFKEKDKSRFLSLLRSYVQNCVAQEKNIDFICLQCNGVIGEQCSFAKNNQRCHSFYKIKHINSTNKEED
jgi:DNA-binding MarR family transcriptional regulator